MSQDLLSEFDSLYSAPVPPPVASFTPTSSAPPLSRRFTSADPWDPRDPLNLNLPPAPRPQLPLHNVPLVRTASHGHQHRASATNFDDLLGIVNSPQAPWPPRAPQVNRLANIPRPVSYHGVIPSASKIDMLAALGNDFSGSDGRGGRFTPPPPRPSSRNDYSNTDGRRKSQTVSMARSPVGGYGGFSAPTPPPDLLGLDNDDDDDGFGDFESATPSMVPTSVNTGTGFRATPNTTPPRNGYGGNTRNATPPPPPPPPTPPKPKYQHRHQKSLIDDDDFGDFIASPIVANPPRNMFSTPPPNSFSSTPPPRSTFNTPPPNSFTAHPPTRPFNTPPPNLFNTPPPLSAFTPSQPQHTPRPSITLKTFSSPPRTRPATPLPPIPPVSTLLTAFPPLFLLPQTHLLDKLTILPFPLRQRVLAHPNTKQFLEAICELGRVAGRIIAGRKRRNRASLPSSGARNRSGSSGGMKLGTNASWEQQKEEREVKETCRLWGDEAGRLKAAMGKGVPELLDEGVPGGRGTAAGRGSVGGVGCRLCGLAKGEVVVGLKEVVERGGWWVEGWGHGGCRAFWEKHGKGLKV